MFQPVGGELLKSRGDRRLIEFATLAPPTIGSETLGEVFPNVKAVGVGLPKYRVYGGLRSSGAIP